jgi:hypothetical protein
VQGLGLNPQYYREKETESERGAGMRAQGHRVLPQVFNTVIGDEAYTNLICPEVPSPFLH